MPSRFRIEEWAANEAVEGIVTHETGDRARGAVSVAAA